MFFKGFSKSPLNIGTDLMVCLAALTLFNEYKPNEPRSFSLMPDVSTTLMAIKEVGNKNMGVVLDFAHVMYADELPAYSANLIGRYSEILGVHLNDGYGKWDNGLMVGSVHPIQIIELLVELKKLNYKRAIYFIFSQSSLPNNGSSRTGNVF